MAGNKAEQVIQLGKETTKGTAVAATAIWRGQGGQLQDDRTVTFVPEQVGYAVPTNRTYTGKLGGSLAMAATPATFEQLPYLFEASIIAETPAADGAGSGIIYDYVQGTVSVNSIRTYTLESGDNQQAEEMAYCFVTDWTLSAEAGDAVMMSANWIGREPAPTTITDLITAGPQTVETILAGKGSLYIDASSGTAGTTQVSDTLLGWSLNYTSGRQAKYTVDSGQLYFDFDYFDIDSFDAVLNLKYEHNASAVTEKAAWRAETARLIQLKVTGSTLTTSGTTYSVKTLILNMAGKYETFEALSDENGNSIVNCTFRVSYDETDDTVFEAIVVNQLAALV